MKRRELREHIFQLLFRVEFNGQEDMQEQVDLFVDDMKENGEVRPEDEAYISGKYQKIMELQRLIRSRYRVRKVCCHLHSMNGKQLI